MNVRDIRVRTTPHYKRTYRTEVRGLGQVAALRALGRRSRRTLLPRSRGRLDRRYQTFTDRRGPFGWSLLDHRWFGLLGRGRLRFPGEHEVIVLHLVRDSLAPFRRGNHGAPFQDLVLEGLLNAVLSFVVVLMQIVSRIISQ